MIPDDHRFFPVHILQELWLTFPVNPFGHLGMERKFIPKVDDGEKMTVWGTFPNV